MRRSQCLNLADVCEPLPSTRLRPVEPRERLDGLNSRKPMSVLRLPGQRVFDFVIRNADIGELRSKATSRSLSM